jgi:hypothetical protein
VTRRGGGDPAARIGPLDTGRFPGAGFREPLTGCLPLRLILPRMISNASLSAFSASNGVSSPGSARPAPVQRAQATAPARSAPLPPASPGGGPAPPSPTRLMPRGSLLDLSV